MCNEPQGVVRSDIGETSSIAGEDRTLDDLFTRLYEKIRHLASRVRWNGTNPTLNPTALAHEAYMKVRKSRPELANKSYDEVLAVFANAMRQILIDAARRKSAQKRLAGDSPERTHLPIEQALTISLALERLERENVLQARVVQCRFLFGMTVQETAAVLRISSRAVERQWQEAKGSLTAKADPDKE